MRPAILLCCLLILLPPPASAAPKGAAACARIAEVAGAVGLAPAFLARVLWERGEMTAGLAIPATAGQLAGLQERFGNPGLAALALSGGAALAERYLAGEGIVPAHVDFVILTTGEPPEYWRNNPQEWPEFRLAPEADFATACRELIAGRRGEPLPELPPLPEAGPVEPALTAAALPSLRPRLRPTPKLEKWGAQLAFGNSRERARANFDRVTRVCREVVGRSPDLVFVENRVRGRPGYWMARVSRMDRDAAEAICRDARRRGCSCAVYKNY